MISALILAANVNTISAQYLSELWKSSPMAASQAGYHKDHVDEHLDDLSAEARARRLGVLKDLSGQLPTAQTGDAEADADVALLQDAIRLESLDLEEAHDFQKRCDKPLDDLGSAFFNMAVRDYAPLDERASAAFSRLKEVPRYLQQAKASLHFDVDVFAAAAKDDGEGLIDYLQHDLQLAFAKSKHATALGSASAEAVKAVREYLGFIENDLPKMPHADFRYGDALYRKRFRPYLQTDQDPSQVLAAAEKRLKELHVEMSGLAEKLIGKADIRAALNKIAEEHPKAEALFDVVKAQLKEARDFIEAKKLMTLRNQDNLQVIETPPFLRAMLGVAAFDGAPPYQPELGAFYYVTPIPKDWPAAKVESKLREYNRYGLELLTIHEAMPGHYVQFERANQVQPEVRRVLRWVLSATSYVEGWAVYTQDLMVDAGYLGADNAKLKLQARKLELRAVANTILDIKLQTQKMSDEEALRLMMDETFQERPEAEAKLRRAKLSVTQLCSYFVGGETWRAIRRQAEKRRGFTLKSFHDRVLSEGAMTLRSLSRVVGN